MKKIITVLLAAMIIALGTVSSYADIIISPSAPIFTDTDSSGNLYPGQNEPNAPKTGDYATSTAVLLAACGAVALSGVALNKKLSK